MLTKFEKGREYFFSSELGGDRNYDYANNMKVWVTGDKSGIVSVDKRKDVFVVPKWCYEVK